MMVLEKSFTIPVFRYYTFYWSFGGFWSSKKMLIRNMEEKKNTFQHLIDLSPEAIFVHREGNIYVCE